MQPVRDPQILGAVIFPSDWAAGPSPRLGMCSAGCCSPAVPACNNIDALNGNAITLPAAGNISHQQQTYSRGKIGLKDGLKRDLHSERETKKDKGDLSH